MLIIFCKYQFFNGGHLGFQNGGIWIRSGMRDQLFFKCLYHPLTISEVKIRVHFSAHGSLLGSWSIWSLSHLRNISLA